MPTIIIGVLFTFAVGLVVGVYLGVLYTMDNMEVDK